ncbi:NACHT, LRR and PYD domains-containing protein 12 [Rhinichthys klamathensis goyatoka]|uniref:NACHT, LRR and PYD domains-containing protein 12 n=1 Tax=Rhinichthys klamathensis goyatoka TaxID=3034132 RepID=UPI0024B51DBA|nr:NACHT, LRR and PYD domains-containing protein 12 [Rhinichthys klamathensis goyatoka]
MSAGENEDGSVPMSSPEEDLHSERTKQERSDSPTSHLSLKSTRSIPLPLNFSDEAQTNTESTKQERSDSPTSHLSLKSTRSIPLPLNFSDEAQRNTERTKQEESDSTSHLSLKSGRSIPLPLNFSSGPQKNIKRRLSVEETQDQGEYRPAKRVCQQHYGAPVVFCKTDNMHICSICMGQEHQGHSKFYIVKSNVPGSQTILHDKMENMETEFFKTFKRELSEDYPECLGNQPEKLSPSDAAKKLVESFGGEAALRITWHFVANANPLQKITDANKAKLKNKCQHLNEGNSSQGQQCFLKDIYTDLYMRDGGSGEINNEHEVLRIEVISQNRNTQGTSFACNDIFKTLPGQRKQIRTVLTMGIAGIGKHVSVQKFILDWADGKSNHTQFVTVQDINVIIHLPFRDLFQKKGNCSLLQLVQQYAPEVKEENLSKLKVIFILDGLEVCQYPLDFHKNDYCSDINKKVNLDVLLTNLIKGNLLPSALLWITTRPSTANRIPPECVHQVTEIRGFNDHQKEAYFRKKISDQKLASEIIAHIKSCQSLYIMCHMPIFCWISATVLENMMSDGNSDEIPRTLTEMFTHFLLIQISLKHKKFNGADANNPKKLSEFDKTLILKLGELAFKQMEKHNFIFQEEDLKKGDIDASQASEYSVFTEIFREELGLYREKVYSFVHVSYQEYLAAIYAHFACVNDGKNVLEKDKKTNLSNVHQSAVDKALESENGHLDLFLRFLLGLSVETNCNLLEDLVTKGSSCKPCVDKNLTVCYIKEKIKLVQSPERIINLFHCLNELNDNTLVKEIQTAMKSGTLRGSELEPEQWSALAYVLLKSGEVLDEFDMKKFNTSTENQIRLLPVLKICKMARLDCCNLSSESCGRIASALQSVNSPLRELDLSNNKLKKCGATILFSGLASPLCQLQKLKLAGCDFPSAFCTNLASALESTNSLLTELNLSYNTITKNGVEQLCAGLISQNCKLQKLKLKQCGLLKASCAHLASVLKSSYSDLKELELKNNDLGDSGVNQLSKGLHDPQCTLEKLGLSGCMITEVGCSSLASALNSNGGHLRELDLSYNHPGDLGVKLLSDKKDDPTCKLEKLNVEKGGECRTNPGLRKYACQLTVDPNTAHPLLKLSEGNQRISETTEEQKYPEHPERFKLYPMALCTEALKGRCYFEVECNGGVGVGVAYKTLDRKESIMGVKNTFPALLCLNGKSKLLQNNEITCAFPVITQSKRVGVYVDLELGSLSYYSICNYTSRHLHTHHTKFKGPLYTGFTLLPDSSVTLCKLT